MLELDATTEAQLALLDNLAQQIAAIDEWRTLVFSGGQVVAQVHQHKLSPHDRLGVRRVLARYDLEAVKIEAQRQDEILLLFITVDLTDGGLTP